MTMPAQLASPTDFAGKRVLVTGGTKGIGEAVAARLRQGGAKVLATARGSPENRTDAGLFVAADIATAQGCVVVAEAVTTQLGGIDIVVHVAGGSSAPAGGFAVLDDKDGSVRSTSTCSRPYGWIGLSCR